MAYISRECVTCTDRTKRSAGKFKGRDENGKFFSGDMYTCDNCYCQINIERMRTQKKLRQQEADSTDRHWRDVY